MENKKNSTKPKSASSKIQTEAPQFIEEQKVIPIDPNQYVTVINGYQGRLIYKSRRTGERFDWGEFGADQEMQLRELKNAKSSSKGMFINNWFMFEEDWILDYLGVRNYYKNSVDINTFSNIFSLPHKELEKTIKSMPVGQRRSVSYVARQMIRDKKIDSLKTISILEKSLGVDLIEK